MKIDFVLIALIPIVFGASRFFGMDETHAMLITVYSSCQYVSYKARAL